MATSPQLPTRRLAVRGIPSRRLLELAFGVLFVLGVVLALLDSAA